jgi:glutaminyl-tRNA synthetase
LYDRLFRVPNPGSADSLDEELNPDSLSIVAEARLEPALLTAVAGSRYQFERLGYFAVDSEHSAPGRPVFNRVVTLRDTWARLEQAALESQTG